jgi:hypothetical protein
MQYTPPSRCRRASSRSKAVAVRISLPYIYMHVCPTPMRPIMRPIIIHPPAVERLICGREPGVLGRDRELSDVERGHSLPPLCGVVWCVQGGRVHGVRSYGIVVMCAHVGEHQQRAFGSNSSNNRRRRQPNRSHTPRSIGSRSRFDRASVQSGMTKVVLVHCCAHRGGEARASRASLITTYHTTQACERERRCWRERGAAAASLSSFDEQTCVVVLFGTRRRKSK